MLQYMVIGYCWKKCVTPAIGNLTKSNFTIFHATRYLLITMLFIISCLLACNGTDFMKALKALCDNPHEFLHACKASQPHHRTMYIPILTNTMWQCDWKHHASHILVIPYRLNCLGASLIKGFNCLCPLNLPCQKNGEAKLALQLPLCMECGCWPNIKNRNALVQASWYSHAHWYLNSLDLGPPDLEFRASTSHLKWPKYGKLSQLS